MKKKSSRIDAAYLQQQGLSFQDKDPLGIDYWLVLIYQAPFHLLKQDDAISFL